VAKTNLKAKIKMLILAIYYYLIIIIIKRRFFFLLCPIDSSLRHCPSSRRLSFPSITLIKAAKLSASHLAVVSNTRSLHRPVLRDPKRHHQWHRSSPCFSTPAVAANNFTHGFFLMSYNKIGPESMSYNHIKNSGLEKLI
jgi:hypothetical protein